MSRTDGLTILLTRESKPVCHLTPSEPFKRDLLLLMRKHGYGMQIQLSLPPGRVAGARGVRGLWPSNTEMLLAAVLVLSRKRPKAEPVTYAGVTELCRQARVRIPEGNHLHVTAALARRKGLIRPAAEHGRGEIELTSEGVEKGQKVLDQDPELSRRLLKARAGTIN